MAHLKLFASALLSMLQYSVCCCQQIKSRNNVTIQHEWSSMHQLLTWKYCYDYCAELDEKRNTTWHMPTIGESLDMVASTGAPEGFPLCIWTQTPFGYNNIYDATGDTIYDRYFVFRISDKTYFNVKSVIMNNCICVR